MRRFSNEFKVAFDAWLKTNPFSNPNAAPGPSFTPGYRNPQILQGVAANHEASRIFDEGTAARKQSEEYTGTTVVLATGLFLVALHRASSRAGCGFSLLLLTGPRGLRARDHPRVPLPLKAATGSIDEIGHRSSHGVGSDQSGQAVNWPRCMKQAICG